MLMACISESSGSQVETLRTLKFAMSAARIKNKPVRFLSSHDKLVQNLREEIKRYSPFLSFLPPFSSLYVYNPDYP